MTSCSRHSVLIMCQHVNRPPSPPLPGGTLETASPARQAGRVRTPHRRRGRPATCSAAHRPSRGRAHLDPCSPRRCQPSSSRGLRQPQPRRSRPHLGADPSRGPLPRATRPSPPSRASRRTHRQRLKSAQPSARHDAATVTSALPLNPLASPPHGMQSALWRVAGVLLGRLLPLIASPIHIGLDNENVELDTHQARAPRGADASLYTPASTNRRGTARPATRYPPLAAATGEPVVSRDRSTSGSPHCMRQPASFAPSPTPADQQLRTYAPGRCLCCPMHP